MVKLKADEIVPGIVFKQKFYSHLSGHNCPKCKSSIGERLINIFLDIFCMNFFKYFY